MCDALETDWLAEAARFEHLHSRIEIAKTLTPVIKTRICASLPLRNLAVPS
jgi:hypothetical protein